MEKKISREHIREKILKTAEGLGQYIEESQDALPRYESLPIAIKGVMDQLYYDTLLEKDGVLNKAVREYREEE